MVNGSYDRYSNRATYPEKKEDRHQAERIDTFPQRELSRARPLIIATT